MHTLYSLPDFFCSLGTEVLAIAFRGCVCVFSNHLSVEVGERSARGLRNRGSGMLRTSLGMLISLRIIAGMRWRGVLLARDRNSQRNLGNWQFSELRKSGFTFKIGGIFAGRSGTDSLGAISVSHFLSLDAQLLGTWENDSSLKGMGRTAVARGTQWLI